jgi:pimeloyl-ACP methyl ester carboxylesterase
MPIVEYQHVDAGEDASLPVLLCFAGGGCSGTVFALLAETCLARGIRVVAFDMPGHTPAGLLGAATPPRSLISATGTAVRRAVAEAMVARWRERGTGLAVLAHSAGAVDVARIGAPWREAIARFVLCGAGTPGLRALLIAQRASGSGRPADQPTLREMFLGRLIPAGALTAHYGPASARCSGDAVLAPYHCAENVSVAASLLRASAVTRHDWRGRRVRLVGSAGDAICPPQRIHHAGRQLAAAGARVSTEIVDGPFPHMFIAFASPADRIAELAAQG